jgi:hypothetical protein
MAGISSYTPVTISGTYFIDPTTEDAVFYSTDSIETSMVIDSLVPTDYTILYTANFESLPPSLSYLTTERCFVGVWDDNGSSVGLYFSQAGIGFGAGLGESVVALPDSYGIVQEGEYYTILLATSSSNGAVFIHITKTDDLDNGYPHNLRWVLSFPGQTLSKGEGFTLSVIGNALHPTQVSLDTVCLGTGTLIPDQPPIADAGQEQEARLCTFVQLDGSNSYDPEGAPLTYLWRLIDAPAASSYVFEAYDGSTSPESPPTGYTDELTSSELEAEHTTTPILNGDVLLISGTPHTVVSVGVGPFVVYVEGQTIPDNLSQAAVKLVRQSDTMPTGTAEKPIFYPDAAGFWKFDLTVNDGSLNSVDKSVVVVHVKESLVATGVTPDMSFLWNYVSDFWRLVEDRERIEVVWSAIAQIVGANLMSLWQVDYNKSLRDIQRSMQRRWLYYDLLIQEPFIALTTVQKMDNIAGFLVGSDGLKVADRNYEITSDLSAEDIQDGDFLILDGLAYKISKYVPVGGSITTNRVSTYEDFPTGMADYQIARPSSSTQINFYEGLVVEDDNVLLEVITKETGEYQYFFTEVMGVSELYPDKLCVDPTPVLAYLDDTDTYSVYLSAVFRRKYVPINERIVDIPRLQKVIKDPPTEEVLHRGVDFFLDTFRGLPCIRWESVWKYYDESSVLQDDLTPPARLWAETTYIENLSTIEANFGVLAGFTLDDHAELPGDMDYLSAVRGLWYVHFSSPSLYNVRVGAQILLGLPFAEESGTIQEIRDDIVSPTNTILVLDDVEDGIVRSYNYPAGLGLEVNPDTGVSYVVGDSIEQFAPLVKGATVIDYKSDPAWFGKFVSQGVFSEAQKFHRFGVEIEQDAYTLAGVAAVHRLVLDIKPTYTYPMVIIKVDAGIHDIDVQDTIKFGLKLNLYDGAYLQQTFGHASMWDEGDPSPMKMSVPPDGGTPLYDHTRIVGIHSGWQSAYDEPVGLHALYSTSAMFYHNYSCERFDGAVNFVNFFNTFGFERTDLFSISMWVKAGVLADFGILACKQTDQPDYTGWFVGIETSGAFTMGLTHTSGGDELVMSTTAGGFNDGAWHHIVVTYAGTSAPAGVHIYIDGTDEPLSTVANTLSGSILNAVSHFMGKNPAAVTGDEYPYEGFIDEYAIYNKVLAGAEVTEIFNGGTPTDLALLSTEPNLAGWWRLGDHELTGNRDWSTGNAYGAIQDVSMIVEGAPVAAYYVEFGGTDEYATAGKVLLLERTDAFSVVGWFRTSTAGQQFILAKMGDGTTYTGYGVHIDASDRLGIYLSSDWTGGDRLSVYTDNTWTDGVWHHFAVTYDGTSAAAGVTIYVDGAPEATTTEYDALSSSIGTDAPLLIGSRSSSGSTLPFTGGIDELQVYGKELSQVEVEDLYFDGVHVDPTTLPTEPDLVEYWPMGDFNVFPYLLNRSHRLYGSLHWLTARDLSGNGYDGTLVNMEVGDLSADVVGGTHSLKSLKFDGTNEYVTMGNVLDKTKADAFSISCWAKSSTAATQWLVSKFDATPVGYGVRFNSNGSVEVLMYKDITHQWAVQTTAQTFLDGGWYHITMTFDGVDASGIHIYLDGNDEALTVVENTLGAEDFTNVGSLNFGARSDGAAEFLTGLIDEVAIYGKELSGSEVTEIYNSGEPTENRALGTVGDLEGYWPLGDETPLSGQATMTNMEAGDITLYSRSYSSGSSTIVLVPEEVSAPGDGTITDMLLVFRRSSSWVYDPEPRYDIAVKVDGSVVYTAQVVMSFTDDEYRYKDTALNESVTAGQVISVEVSPTLDSGSAHPSWELIHVKLYATYTGNVEEVIWGYDKQLLLPESEIVAVMALFWAGGEPDLANPMFVEGTDIYQASTAGGHIVLDTVPVPWRFYDNLPAGTYGRRVTL